VNKKSNTQTSTSTLEGDVPDNEIWFKTVHNTPIYCNTPEPGFDFETI
jgi:hypothetical protein